MKERNVKKLVLLSGKIKYYVLFYINNGNVGEMNGMNNYNTYVSFVCF